MPDPWEQDDRENTRIAKIEKEIQKLKEKNYALEEENHKLRVRLDTSEENIRFISEAWRKKATQLESDLARERER